MMSKVEEYEKMIVKSDEYLKYIDEKIAEYTLLKAEKLLNKNLWINKLREEKEKEEMMKEDKPPIKEDPLINFKASKQLKHNELDELSFNKRSFEINVVDVKVGDYIKVYTKKEITLGRVKRMTDKTFFINPIVCNDANKCNTFNFMVGINKQYLDSIYNYYFINVIDNHNISNQEIKILKKCTGGSSGKIKKVDKNFIEKTVWDFGI
jgi:hypothetical protein